MPNDYSRRQFLSLGGRLSAGALLCAEGLWKTGSGASAAPVGDGRPLGSDLVNTSVRSLAEAIRAKRVSSVEVVQAYLERIKEVNPWLNAVVRITAESALEQARRADTLLASGKDSGPLHGVPMSIKDSLNTAGVVTTWSVPARADFVPDRDATVVARLKGAGAILLGKTNTPELTLSFETNSPLFGPTNNPYDVDRTSGGSSGGAAAIVAAGGSPFDIGSDTGGSVRVPAHCCGVAGMRPTSGRVPRTGNAIGPGGLIDMLTSIGPIARYVEDLELILPLISGPDTHDPAVVPMPFGAPGRVELKGLRGSFHTDNGIRSPTKETIAAVQASVQSLSDAGVMFEEVRPPDIEQTLDIFLELFNWGSGAWQRMLLEKGSSRPAEIAGSAEMAEVPADGLVRMIHRWDRFRSRMLAFFAPFDLLVCPANALPALPHGKSADNLDAFSYTMTYSLTGWPGAVVRAGESPEGLPIGVQVVARPWREDTALAAAAHIERELGGWRAPDL